MAEAVRADARRNYEHLLAVAGEAFAEHGTDASLRDVARRAGVGIGTLYRHFPTRETLLEALMSSRFDVLRASAEDLLGAPSPATDCSPGCVSSPSARPPTAASPSR